MQTSIKHSIVALLAAAAAGAIAQNNDDRPCGDQNLDGLVTPADYNAWILNFNSGSPLADVNRDGAVTPADYNAWILAYNQFPNGPGCPAAIESGLSVTGAISFLGDTDTFEIEAGAGDDIRIAISEPADPTDFSPSVDVFAPNGDRIAGTWDFFGFNVTAANVPASGTYSIVVRDISNDEIGSYTMTAVVPDDAIDIGNRPIPSGTTLTGTIGLGDIDTFTIDADFGDDIRIAISEPGDPTGFSPAVNVYAPNGDRIAGTWDFFGFDVTASNVPMTGTYTIVVQDISGDIGGDYIMTAVVPDADDDVNTVAIPSGTTLTGVVGLGDIDTFTIDADFGDDIRIAISEPTDPTDFSPSVNIYAPNGDRIAGTWDFFGFDVTASNVPETGTYTIVVQDISGDVGGDYIMTAVVPDADDDVNTVAIPSGTTLTGTVGLGDIDTFTIDADFGDDIRIAISEPADPTDFSPSVNVYAPSGDRVAGTWDFFGFDVPVSNVPETGTYTIVVQDISGDVGGDYVMTAVVPDSATDADNVSLPDGASRIGTVELGDIDTFTTSVAAGNDLTISISETGADTSFSPAVNIYAPNGDRIAGTWDFFSFDVTASNVPITGTYTIVVQDISGDEAGEYQVQANVAP